MENDPREELARIKAEMDQAIAGLGETARALRALFTELQSEGFDEAQAMRLTSTWLRAMLAKPPEPE